MSRAYKALKKLEYKQGKGILGRKTAIHGSTVGLIALFAREHISLVIFLSKDVRDY